MMQSVRCRWGLVALAAFACGDNIPLGRAHELVIVAHQDDDLLFMQPDLSDAIHRGSPTTIVYVTAGDAGAGLDYATSRIIAAKAAYGWIGGSQAWQCGWVSLAGHAAERCDLPSAELALVFLGYPDGFVSGNHPDSLLRLWEGAIDHADTVAEHPARYDRQGLIDAVGEIIALSRPAIIRTLELSAMHGTDHSDHMLVGALALLAAARQHTDATILSYRGYNVNFEPPNIPDAIFNEISLGMRAYEACQIGCAPCGEVCETLPDSRYLGFLHRHYAVATRQPPMSGFLQTDGGCVIVEGDTVSLGDCARATTVRWLRGGSIQVGNRCLRLTGEHRMVAGTCRESPESYFALDEEGHLWSGVATDPGPLLDVNHTLCLLADAGGVHGEACGGAVDQRWRLGQRMIATPRAQIGTAAQGRSVQLADVTGDGMADLCRIENGGLWCAVGDGAGGFGQSVRIDAPDQPLAIVPSSLMLGDLDGDGVTDACGRSARGLVCAIAAHGYAAELWSPAFGGLQTAALRETSLSIVDRRICGMTDGGVACAAEGEPAAMSSTWPAGGATLWPADLDGDGKADWCMSTDAGPACGLDADRVATSEGAPWAYAFNGFEGTALVGGATTDQLHGAVADISGDGLADLCVVAGSAVECSLSQTHSFGPRFPVLGLPAGTAIQALWLGDLDGDGKADACVDDGTSILCTLSP